MDIIAECEKLGDYVVKSMRETTPRVTESLLPPMG